MPETSVEPSAVRSCLSQPAGPALVPDLLDGRFDVAMSGIHITDERRAAGRFSRPYLESGKQAVVRCSDVGRFHTLEDVDRLGVQVLTNIGGTNDAFVRDEFANATVVRDPDKQHLVERLAAGEGDVLFADALEATFYVERDPTLCLGLGGGLFGNYQVAVFMRRESDLAAAVDRWLTERRRQGYVAMDDPSSLRGVATHRDARPPTHFRFHKSVSTVGRPRFDPEEGAGVEPPSHGPRLPRRSSLT